MRIFFLTLLLSIPSTSAFSQNWFKIDSVFSPFGVTAGNFSSPDFGDLDGDGDLDMIIGSLSDDRIQYFKNVGTAAAPVYRRDTTMFSSIYANGTQFTNSAYPVLVDIDKDDDLDLVISGFNGMILYWNGGDKTEAIWFRDSVFFSGLYDIIGTDAKPAFTDLDGDGDPDMLIGVGESFFDVPTAAGVTLGFRNTGTFQNPKFTPDSTLVAGIPDVGLNAFPTFADLDNDGDKDLLMGRDLQTFLYYKNAGTANSPAWTNTAGIFSAMETSSYWKVPILADMDGDGDLDLTYGSDDGTLYHYRNIGTKTSPQFQLFNGYFQMIRTTGNGATVSLADIDKDGDIDMISGDWLGGVQYFRNDGNAAHPNFVKTTAAFTSINVSSYSVPRFVDIDGDGDLDIACGRLDGTVSLWLNNNGTFAANASVFSGIDIGWQSAPAFADLDNDGDLDLLVGAETGSASMFYKNSGLSVFSAESSWTAGISFPYHSNPTFVDLDKDGDFDLVIGSGFGDVYYYENIGSKSAPVWQRNDARMAPIEVKQGASLGFADFDNDGRQDVIIAQYNGLFTFYKNMAPTAVRQASHQSPVAFGLQQNYPNPFNPTTTITFSVPSDGMTTLTVFNALGQEVAVLINGMVAKGTYHQTVFDASRLSSGIYLARLEQGGRVQWKKMLLLK